MRSIVFYIISCNLILLLTVLSPRYGSKYIFIDLGLCAFYGEFSLLTSFDAEYMFLMSLGAYTVLATKSLSSLLNLTLYKLFTYTVSYVLIIVLIFTAIMQIKYLNKALQRFDSTAVIPTQFVLFTISAIIGSAVIYRDFDNDDASQLAR
ncbi:hypothetical protein DFQ28_010739 [Apophysomyces sp. BC1034]|nr:hypothetical protein DFQ30_010492 [Apophysomyces sp. BC1015]KAG0191878.1 hypothetical protein DFQ28_010739 [Apophysomyces sp. BC1034]